LHSRIRDEIICVAKDDAAVRDALLSTFRLDIKSDPKTLDGASLDTIRRIHREDGATVGGLPRATNTGVVLLVDEETLTEAQDGLEHWVKAMEIGYEPERYNKWHPRMGGQRYFGWMKAYTNYLVYLWEELICNYQELHDVAPQTIGGMMLVVWPTEMTRWSLTR